ncbi:Ly-6/neurotoxin-like protein [Melia azedarach]|uniref:Ly-6/neurotoxin-like protein n=1 Tax=Melia azedarach TaxID=155640 RepID=A0ACC1XAY0_MELAZ|nr:Ly-6/neurotoxin-like protein [Melia azedarach]
MCYAGVARRDLVVVVVQGRWFVLRTTNSDSYSNSRVVAERAANEVGGGGGGSTKQCVCSPTRHPGSFRCRLHHAEYVWRGRIAKSQSTTQ